MLVGKRLGKGQQHKKHSQPCNNGLFENPKHIKGVHSFVLTAGGI
jgi:hypothetical protein